MNVLNKMTALEKGWTEQQVKDAVKRVNEIWNAYTKANKTIVAPMLKGMPKKAADYFSKYFAKNSYGYVENDKQFCQAILGHMGVTDEDAEIFYVTQVNY